MSAANEIGRLNLELLTKLVFELERDTSLERRSCLQRRLKALDRIEAYLFPLSVARSELGSRQAALHHRLEGIQRKLEAINAEVYAAIRRDIRSGDGRTALLSWLPQLRTSLVFDRDGYDLLDDVIAGVFEFEEPEPTIVKPTADMVFYQPTPARHIFDLLERAAITEEDVVVDIGSGLGHVSMLTSLWTNARSIGVELEPAYIACARRVVESLNLKRVTFIEEDAQSSDYGTGTVFYLYTPFTGAMLRDTLISLRRQADTRAIKVCALGRCVPLIAAEDWLTAVGEVTTDRVCIFRSRVPR
jgi:hypothetical protein